MVSFLDKLGGEPCRAPRNGILLEANVRATALLRISEGWAIRYRLLPNGRRQILNILLPGDVLGLEALAMHPVTYSVQATTEVGYRIWDAQRVLDLISQSSRHPLEIIQMLLRERRVLDEWLTYIGACNAEQRVTFLFINLYERLRVLRLTRGNSFTIGLTQQQMADSLGLNLTHFHRVLGRLHARRFLTTSDHKVVLNDVARLRSLTALQSQEPG